MGRYILRYQKPSPAPVDELQRIRATPGLKVIDASPQMMLVDAEELVLHDKMKTLTGWTVHPEQGYPVPDTRHTLD
jgi:hypothetical protein